MMREHSIQCMMLPLMEKSILLPNIAVAELITTIPQINFLEQEKKWLYGTIEWHNITIPILSLETISSGSIVVIPAECMIVIINPSTTKLKYYGILIHGLPKLTRIFKNISCNIESITDDIFPYMVQVNKEELFLLNIDKIESLIISEYSL